MSTLVDLGRASEETKQQYFSTIREDGAKLFCVPKNGPARATDNPFSPNRVPATQCVLDPL